MRQRNFNAGDLIVFFHGHERWHDGSKELGWIIRHDFDDPSHPAVLMGFPGRVGEYHYFERELREWEKAGTIEVKRG